MKVNRDKKSIPLKEAGKITGYAPDYIGYLIRKRKIKGRKVYTNVSWVIASEEIIKYRQKRKNLEVRDFSLLNKKYLSLKEAAKISGYSPDYIGWLIRAGKIAGRKIYAGISWQTTEEAIRKYQGLKEKRKESSEVLKPYLELTKKIALEILGLNIKSRRIFNIGWRFSLATLIIFFLISGFAPIKFLQSSFISAITGGETKTIKFYSTVSYGEWQNPQNAQGPPEVGPLSELNSFSEVNSAVYKTGPLTLICENFVAEQQETTTEITITETTTTETTTMPEVIEEGEATSTETTSTEATTTEATTTEATSTEDYNLPTALPPSAGPSEATSTPPIEEEQEVVEEETTSTEATSTTATTSEPISFFEKTKRLFGFEAYAQENTFSAKIKFSFAIGEKELDISIIEQSTTTESTTSPPTSFWQKVKSFFGSLVIRVASIAKAEETTTEEATTTEATTTPEITTTTEATTTEIEATTTEATTEAITETLPNLDARIIIWWSLDGINWQQLVTISDYPLSNFLNGGYFEYDAPFLKNWDDIKNLKIKFEGVVGGETNVTAYLDSVWVEVEYQEAEKEEEFELRAFKKDWRADETPTFEIVSTKEENIIESLIGQISSIFEEEPKIEAKLDKPDGEELPLQEGEDFIAETHSPTKITIFRQKDFQPGLHKLQINFEKNSKVYNLEEDFTWGVLAINVNKSIYLPGDQAYLQMAVLDEQGHTLCDANLTLEITAPDGTKTIFKTEGQQPEITSTTSTLEEATSTEATSTEETSTEATTTEATSTPATTTTEVQTESGSPQSETSTSEIQEIESTPEITTSSTSFWNKINNPFSIFEARAANDSSVGVIERSSECGPNSVTYTPDYYAYYNVTGPGKYEIKLTAVTKNGTREITDSFEVREWVPFDVERIGPTRIYPPAAYEMTLRIKVNQDFVGQVVEQVPLGFRIENIEYRANGEPLNSNPNILNSSDVQEIHWQVDWKTGETHELKYQFDAPDVSPYIYLLGPLTFETRNKDLLERFKEVINETSTDIIFSEARQWQIAADQAGNMILFWAGATDTPDANWTCLSCGSGDFWQAFPRGAASYGSATSGSDTHTHTATVNVADNTTDGGYKAGVGTAAATVAPTTHNHPGSATVSSTSNLPVYRNLKIIKYNSGVPSELPTGIIALFDDVPISGSWTRYSIQDNYYIRGSNSTSSGGSTTHSHTVTSTIDETTASAIKEGTTGVVSAITHTHTLSATTTNAVDNLPPYTAVLLYQLDATTTIPDGMIGLFDDTPSYPWDVISDGESDPFYQRFLMASSTYGGQAGTSTHSHNDITGLTTTDSAGTVGSGKAGTGAAHQTHSHTASLTGFSSTSSLPIYRDVIVAKYFPYSTSASSTAYSFQRKTWYDGARYWQAFNDGTRIVFWYSTDETNWYYNSSATISVATNDFSIEADSANAFIVYTNGYDVEARQASTTTSYPGTGFSWGTAATVYNSFYFSKQYYYPTIAKDTNNKLRVNVTVKVQPCEGSITYDSVTYGMVPIGDQCWLAKNLAVTNGNTAQSCSITRYCYADNAANCTTYGGLYTWTDMMCGSVSCNGTGESQPACLTPVQGICPNGWHIPSHYEWVALERQICSDLGGTDCSTQFLYDELATGYKGTNGEGSAMAGEYDLWSDGLLRNHSNFASSGLAVLPGGYRTTGGSYTTLSYNALLWSSTERGTDAWYRYLNYDDTSVRRNYGSKADGFSVRCVRD